MEIKLYNHLGNGGSFTLNGNKTVSVTVAKLGVDITGTPRRLDDPEGTYYFLRLSNFSPTTFDGYTITRIETREYKTGLRVEFQSSPPWSYLYYNGQKVLKSGNSKFYLNDSTHTGFEENQSITFNLYHD